MFLAVGNTGKTQGKYRFLFLDDDLGMGLSQLSTAATSCVQGNFALCGQGYRCMCSTKASENAVEYLVVLLLVVVAVYSIENRSIIETKHPMSLPYVCVKIFPTDTC